MQKLLNFVAGTAIATALAQPLWAQDTAAPQEPATADTVVATVNGTDITIGHMIVARASLPQQYQQMPDDALFQGILEQLIQQQALADTFTGELPLSAAVAMQNEERSVRASLAIQDGVGEAIPEEDIKAAYEARIADMDEQEEYNASHILVETEEEAKAIREELDGGAEFAAVAREKSTGPSGPNGGELGWFSAGMMVPDFEAATVALEPGQVSDPVETQFGWHVIKLNEVRKKEIPSLEDLREEITGALMKQAIDEKIQATTNDASVERADITGIDAAVLKNVELLD